MTALGRKLWRDLWRIRGQVLAVSLVAAVGVANLVMSRAALESLEASRDRYYREYAFADVFASLTRAPEQVVRRLRALPGVATAQSRVVAFGRAELPHFHEPVQVQAVSLPGDRAGDLNRLHVRAGRAPRPGERDTLLVSDLFAEAHGLRPGDSLTLVLHGRRGRFRIVGIGGSPEFVAQLPPQAIFPDARRFAIVWMPRPALAAAADLRDAFNSVTLALHPGTRVEAAVAAVDSELARYGGTGAIARADQQSFRYLSEELRQLRTLALLFPFVFLGVSAFVLHVVLARLVAVQREQIGTLKAFGYGNSEILRHFAVLALVVGLLGALLGIALGAWLGRAIAALYRDFYRFPFLDITVSPEAVGLGIGVCIGSALVGALAPVLQAARLPPAEAMRPEAPSSGARVRLALPVHWRQAHRLIANGIARRPLRSLLTWIGLALGTAVMMMGRFQSDAIERMVEVQFEQSQREDLTVAFVEPQSPRALAELASIPGVLRVEPQRAVAVRVRHGHAAHRTALVALGGDARLQRTLDADGQPVHAPPRGLLLTDFLAGMLDAAPGDLIELEVLDGRRRTLRLPLVGLVRESFGVQAYVTGETLDRLLGDGPRVTAAMLAVDPARLPAVVAALGRRPAIAAVSQRSVGIRNFYDSMAQTILTFTVIATGFGVVITAGVVFASARVALSERARDLASLRVLGFTRDEVGYLLLGELALLTALAIPLGFVLGNALVAMMVSGFESDLFRVPHHVDPATYGIAALTTLGAALPAGWLVWRRLATLDLIGVLKARD